MIVCLTPSQNQFLINKALQNKNSLIKTIEKGSILMNCKWNVNIADEAADEIRESCMDMLQKIGFDANYNLTAHGKALEELIDIFYMN